MTVSAVTAISGPFVGNGATVAFPFTFDAASATEVAVFVNGVEVTTGFTVSLAAGGNGGTVTFATAPASGVTICIVTDPDFTQDIAFTNGGPFLPETHDEANDRAARRAIYLDWLLSRTAKVPVGETIGNLPAEADRASMISTWDANGDPAAAIAVSEFTGLQSDVAQHTVDIAAEITNRIADVDAEEAARIAAVTAEASTRVTAIAGEAATRLGADNSLSSRIDIEEDARNAGDAALMDLLESGGAIVGNVSLNATTRALLAALDTTVDLPAILTEAERGDTFVLRDAAPYAAAIAADTEQGFYVPSTFDAAKVWIRQAKGPVFLEQFGGKADGLLNNAAIFTVLGGVFPEGFALQLEGNNSVYAFDKLVFPKCVKVRGGGRGDKDDFLSKILITGDGGGAPGIGVNGGVQWFESLCELSGVCISYNNPALQCLVNMSKAGAVGRNIFENFELTMENGMTAIHSNAIALYLANLVGTFPKKGRIRTPIGFKQNVVIRGYFNGCHLKELALGPHAQDIAAGVFHKENPQVDIDASTYASAFRDITFEGAVNGVKAIGQGTLLIDDPYMADVPQGVVWLPSLVVSQGTYVSPSVSGITADATAASAVLTSVSSTAALFRGLKVSVPGAGAAGAVLTGRITAISGTSVTLDTAAGTTVAGASIYYDAYAGHGYMATVAGTTGATPPVWPTTAGGTVVDGTVTWRQMGACAYLNLATVGGGSVQKEVVTLRNGVMSNNICGINALAGAASRPIKVLNIDGVRFDGNVVCGHFDGVKALCARAINFGAYIQRGFNVLNSVIFADGLNSSIEGIVERGADLVIGSGTTGTVNARVPPVGLYASEVRYNGGPRVRTAASTANLTPTFDDDTINYLGIPANRTVNAPTGTAVEGKEIVLRLKDNGTSRTITWNAIFRPIGVALPATTTANKLLVVRTQYNAADVRWDVDDVKQEA